MDNISIYLIIAMCLLSICTMIGVCLFTFHESFITYDDRKEEKELFNKCFNVPAIKCIIQLILFIVSLILIVCDCIKDDKMNDNAYIWVPCMLFGFMIGLIAGKMYWSKIKKPFFKNNFPAQYDVYIDEAKRYLSSNRIYQYEVTTVGNFVLPICSVCFLVGIIIVQCI